ncbi:TetR-like C-terminal domain-containing protein [Streptomyces bobili]|uniref:TetR-like C-terminal domain-containing protein n=1 Tax=Streptomyces bobili TaxID=67280 RepID=UPI0033AA12FE
MEAAHDPALPLRSRLTALARAYLTFATENAELLALMYARKHEPGAAEQMAAAVDRTVGAFERVIADAQRQGEIIEGDPEQLTLFTGATLHGLAAMTVGGMLDETAVLAMTEDLVRVLLHGLTPR